MIASACEVVQHLTCAACFCLNCLIVAPYYTILHHWHTGNQQTYLLFQIFMYLSSFSLITVRCCKNVINIRNRLAQNGIAFPSFRCKHSSTTSLPLALGLSSRRKIVNENTICFGICNVRRISSGKNWLNLRFTKTFDSDTIQSESQIHRLRPSRSKWSFSSQFGIQRRAASHWEMAADKAKLRFLKNRERRAQLDKAPMQSGVVSLQIVGNGSIDCPPSVLIITDTSR